MTRFVRLLLLCFVASLATASVSAEASSRGASRLARRYAAATSQEVRDLRPLRQVIRARFVKRTRELGRCGGFLPAPSALGSTRPRRGVNAIFVAAIADRLLKSLNPALPALQRFVDRLILAGRGDAVLERGARAWLAEFRYLARAPWVPPRLCTSLLRWQHHHFASRYAPLSASQARAFLHVPSALADERAIVRAGRRLRRLGVSRRLSAAFGGALSSFVVQRSFRGPRSTKLTVVR